MELYHEDRRVILIGLQTSLIIHLLIYILLKLLPEINLGQQIYQQPVEITLEDIKKYQPQRVEINKPDIIHRQQTAPVKGIKEPMKSEKTHQVTAQQESPKPAIKQEENITQKTEKPVLNIDNTGQQVSSKVIPSAPQQKEEGKISETVMGEPLSKFDRNVEGDALSRMVVYRPPPVKVETDVPQPSVRVKIFISPSGDVTKVQLLTLTSDPALNREIVSYMLKWKFNRIDENITQYAVLTIYFTR